jgi:hypothetical protein
MGKIPVTKTTMERERGAGRAYPMLSALRLLTTDLSTLAAASIITCCRPWTQFEVTMLNLTVTISPEAECGALARRWKALAQAGGT